jgi:hypothetical protein
LCTASEMALAMESVAVSAVEMVDFCITYVSPRC